MSNIITATFSGSDTSIVTAEQYMFARGQILQIEGLDLPSVYRVNFSNAPTGDSKTQIGTADGVIIPDVYFTTGKPIYAYIMLNTGDDDREIKYDITIPVLNATEPEDDTPTEEQTSIINQAITALAEATTALNEAVTRIDGAVEKIETLTFRINEVGELIEQTGGDD
jgi:hypothetical protein